MNDIVKKQDLLYLEECFNNIKNKKNIQEHVSSIKRILNRFFNLNIDVSITNNTTHKFFGMSIYPSISLMDSLISNMLNNGNTMDDITSIWANDNNNKWILEIDSLLLYDTNLNANPQEMVAVLLHEIGHVIKSGTIPHRIAKVIKYTMLKFNFKVRELCKNSRLRTLFSMSIIEACSNKSYNYISVANEYEADLYVVQYGYAEDLNNFIGKLLKTVGSKDINKSDSEIEKDIEILVNWSVENIAELQMRKTKLKQSVEIQMMKTPSDYVKDVLKNIRELFVKPGEKGYKILLNENMLLKHHDKIITESVSTMLDSNGKVKKITQMDIDILTIETDKIENHNDKIYLLDKIYGYLETINFSLDLIEAGDTSRIKISKPTLISFKQQLEMMRTRVMNIPIKEKRYGLFVKYPVGYEG